MRHLVASLLFFSFLYLLLLLVADLKPFGRQPLPETPAPMIQTRAAAQEFFYTTLGNLPAAQPETPPAKGPRYTLELAVVHSQAAAEARIDALKAVGITAYFTPIHVGTQVIFRIRQGVFTSQSQAEKVKQELHSHRNLSAKIVSLR